MSFLHNALDEVLPIIEKGAPLISAALGQPFAGIAISALAKAFETHEYDLKSLIDKIKNASDADDKLSEAQDTFLNDKNSKDDVLSTIIRPSKFECTLKLEWPQTTS
jgi:hypothetical protein